MSLPCDVAEPKPLWLSHAIARVLNLRPPPRLRDGVEGLGIGLLSSIEADDIGVPMVYASDSGSMRLVWDLGERGVCVSVIGVDCFTYRLVHGGKPGEAKTVKKDRLNAIRNLLGWLYPEANAGGALPLFGED